MDDQTPGSYERKRVAVSRGHLPRLGPAHYRGDATVHWTFTITRRATGWLTPPFHERWREVLLHTCARYDLLCPVYVLMPDHAHLMLMGVNSAGSNQRTAVAFFRKHTRASLAPHDWQHQAHDHVLREDERQQCAFTQVGHYIAENPVRASLCTQPADWPYLGCMLPGYPDITPHESNYWEIFWRIRTRCLKAH